MAKQCEINCDIVVPIVDVGPCVKTNIQRDDTFPLRTQNRSKELPRKIRFHILSHQLKW